MTTWIFIRASRHLCLHLRIFVFYLCSLCYWTKASGRRSDKWRLALLWTVHQMRQKSRNHIWYHSPPCSPSAADTLYKMREKITDMEEVQQMHHLILCQVLRIITFISPPLEDFCQWVIRSLSPVKHFGSDQDFVSRHCSGHTPVTFAMNVHGSPRTICCDFMGHLTFCAAVPS